MLEYYKADNEEHLYWGQFDYFGNEVIEYETHYKIIGLFHQYIYTFTTQLSKKLT